MIALEQLSPIGIGTYQIDRVERAPCGDCAVHWSMERISSLRGRLMDRT